MKKFFAKFGFVLLVLVQAMFFAPDFTLSAISDWNMGGRNVAFAVMANPDQTCSTIYLTSGTNTLTAGYTETIQIDSSTALLPVSYIGGSFISAVTTQTVIPPWLNPATDSNFSSSGALWVSTNTTWPGGLGNSEGNPHNDQWRLFEDSFTLPIDAIVTSAFLSYTADNSADVYLNGNTTAIASTGSTYGSTAGFNFNPPYIFASANNLTFNPVAGLNKLDFVVRNWGDSPEQNQSFNSNPTGLIYRATINYCVPNTPQKIGPPTNMSQCKNSGWKIFNNPTFRNQGQCVSYVQANPKANKENKIK